MAHASGQLLSKLCNCCLARLQDTSSTAGANLSTWNMIGDLHAWYALVDLTQLPDHIHYQLLSPPLF